MATEWTLDQSTAEAIIICINATGAGLLLFVARVLQPMMNAMSEKDFRSFMVSLERTAMADPVTVTLGTLPILAALFYFPKFGVSHLVFSAGFAIWLAGSAVTKIINMPIYKWMREPRNSDLESLRRRRRRLSFGNNLRAWLTMFSVLLMISQFGVLETCAAVIASVAFSIPLVIFSRRYGSG